MNNPVFTWVRIGLINLAILAFIGVVLRYKISFSLPFIDQKFLLHGHSHFAFSGWVSHILMVLMVHFLVGKGVVDAFNKYRWILIGNLLAAYGMLISFPIQGYGLFSIFFSTFSVLIFYLFAVVFWKDISLVVPQKVAGYWLKAALIFGALSSMGTFYLAYTLTSHQFDQKSYLASVYFFLHFQYNGWFFFACMGLLWHLLERLQILIPSEKIIFWSFFTAAIPAYFLSTLWWPLPVEIVFLVFGFALLQFLAWLQLVKFGRPFLVGILAPSKGFGGYAILFSGLALTVKLFLQLGSTYPPLSQLAFGFRPIVIGYLHLVLLGVITLFLLGYLAYSGLIMNVLKSRIGLGVFVSGIIFNELLLMGQGFAALQSYSLPFINLGLIATAILLWLGAVLLAFSGKKGEI